MDEERFKIGDILKWEKIKEYVYPRIAGEDEFKGYLDKFPNTDIADLPVIYIIKIPTDGKEIVTVIIKNEYLEIWEKRFGDLHKKAVENISKAPVVFKPLIDFVKNVPQEIAASEPYRNMYVLTNKEETFGAAEILNVGIMSRITEDFGNDCIIIPSSLHEVLILEDKNMTEKDYAAIRSMVKEINENYVAEKDVLTDSIYRYSRLTGEISIIE